MWELATGLQRLHVGSAFNLHVLAVLGISLDTFCGGVYRVLVFLVCESLDLFVMGIAWTHNAKPG